MILHDKNSFVGATNPGGDIRIVPANGADREWAAQLMARSEPWTTLRRSLETCRAVVNDPEFQVFVGRIDRERCGFLILDPRGLAGAPYLKSLAAADAFRGRGVGTAFIRFAEDYFRPHARYLFLCVSSFNDGARRLYERLGYEHVGTLKDLAVEGASELLMGKRLRPG
jgi:ribosomal protein S18 acetylase RimI-like enzyme